MFIYVGVNTPDGLVLVTSINSINGSVHFERFKKPVSFQRDLAQSVCDRLINDMYQSVIVFSPSEILNQPFVVNFRKFYLKRVLTISLYCLN